MASGKPAQDQIKEFVFKTARAIATSEGGQKLMEETLFNLSPEDLVGTSSGKKEVTVGDAAKVTALAAKAVDLYNMGEGSKVTSEMANAVIKYVDMLPPGVVAKFTGSVEQPGGEASIPAGKGRVGFTIDPKTAGAFYQGENIRADIDRGGIRAGYRDPDFMGTGGEFTASAGIRREGDPSLRVGYKKRFAKGGTVKAYSNSPRKPKLT